MACLCLLKLGYEKVSLYSSNSRFLVCIFNDVFKPGETTSVGQWLTGILSILVIVVSVQSLFKDHA
jgi:hypothetical protein